MADLRDLREKYKKRWKLAMEELEKSHGSIRWYFDGYRKAMEDAITDLEEVRSE